MRVEVQSNGSVANYQTLHANTRGLAFSTSCSSFCRILRGIEYFMAANGVQSDHGTLKRWVIEYSPMMAMRAFEK